MAARPITRAVAQTPYVPGDADPLGVTDADRDESRQYIYDCYGNSEGNFR